MRILPEWSTPGYLKAEIFQVLQKAMNRGGTISFARMHIWQLVISTSKATLEVPSLRPDYLNAEYFKRTFP